MLTSGINQKKRAKYCPIESVRQRDLFGPHSPMQSNHSSINIGRGLLPQYTISTQQPFTRIGFPLADEYTVGTMTVGWSENFELTNPDCSADRSRFLPGGTTAAADEAAP